MISCPPVCYQKHWTLASCCWNTWVFLTSETECIHSTSYLAEGQRGFTWIHLSPTDNWGCGSHSLPPPCPPAVSFFNQYHINAEQGSRPFSWADKANKSSGTVMEQQPDVQKSLTLHWLGDGALTKLQSHKAMSNSPHDQRLLLWYSNG